MKRLWLREVLHRVVEEPRYWCPLYRYLFEQQLMLRKTFDFDALRLRDGYMEFTVVINANNSVLHSGLALKKLMHVFHYLPLMYKGER